MIDSNFVNLYHFEMMSGNYSLEKVTYSFTPSYRLGVGEGGVRGIGRGFSQIMMPCDMGGRGVQKGPK